MNQPSHQIRLANAVLERSRHVCALFTNPDEEYSVLLPFIKEGFDRREKAFHLVDPDLRADHIERLAQAGIDTTAALNEGQLEVRIWQETYLRGGHFDQIAMLALIEELLQEGPAKGYQLTRLVAHMEWALLDLPGVNRLVEYEARLNDILPNYQDPVI